MKTSFTGFKCFAAVCAALTLLAFGACSKNGRNAADGAQAGKTSASGASRTQIVGKVTSVVGNQVVLAVGTLNQTAKNASAAQSGLSASASSQAAESGSGSGGLTLTGETKTVLIPVGLTLTTGRSGGRGSAGTSSGSGTASGAARGNAPAGGTGGFSGGAGGGSGGSAGRGPAASGGSGSAAARTQTAQRTRDFSSITKGMVLRIEEGTLADGTAGIVRVTVLSESE